MNFNKNNHNLIVVYEDEFLIVVNKQAGILTHAKSLKNDFSLINLLLDNNITLCKGENILRPGVVHRLDKETSGLIVFAKTDKAYLSLKQQFYQRKVEKYYHAVVWSTPNPIAGTINIPIASHLGKKKINYSKNSKEAITLYETKKTHLKKFSLIECRILTGRTHQIRVHMLSKGCPLIGDKLYSKGRNLSKDMSEKVKKIVGNFDRHALHATTIMFTHPINNNLLKLKAEKPSDFLKLEQVLFEH